MADLPPIPFPLALSRPRSLARLLVPPPPTSLLWPAFSSSLDLQIVFRGQRSSGYGFVTYKTQEDAERAIDALNKKGVWPSPRVRVLPIPRDRT